MVIFHLVHVMTFIFSNAFTPPSRLEGQSLGRLAVYS